MWHSDLTKYILAFTFHMIYIALPGEQVLLHLLPCGGLQGRKPENTFFVVLNDDLYKLVTQVAQAVE